MAAQGADEGGSAALPPPGATWRQLIAFASHDLGDRREAGWIVEDAGGIVSSAGSRLDMAAPAGAYGRIVEMVGRRRSGEPLQHVLGHWAFRTLEVTVDRRALIPRPETETVTEVALQELDRLHDGDRAGGAPDELDRLHDAARAQRAPHRLTVVDLGTGSGVIALAIATERPFAVVTATDRSGAALCLARENLLCQSPEVQSRLTLLGGEWYAPVPRSLRGGVDVIVSNPPYLARAEWSELDEVVRHDPYEALVAGETGLEGIEAVILGSQDWLARRGVVVVEIAPHQAERARDIALSVEDDNGRRLFENVEVLPDLAGRPRVLRARR